MERNLKVTRIYKLGEFQNIQFTDEILGIPDDLMFEPGFVEPLRVMQLYEIEEQLNKYNAIRTEAYKDASSPEEVIKLLEVNRLKTIEEINKVYQKDINIEV